MKKFLVEHWIWWSNLLLIIIVIARLSVSTDYVTLLFVFIGTYVISFLTSMKLFKVKNKDCDVAF
jgi:hypothetical protein